MHAIHCPGRAKPSSTARVSPFVTLSALCFGIAGIPAVGLDAQPAVMVRDSIVLEESGDDYLVLPIPVIPDGSGGYLVTDYQQPRVFHYSGEGRLLQRYGRQGEGPGEFTEASGAYPWGAGHVLVLSWKPIAAQLFERDTGRFTERFPLKYFVEHVVPDSAALWMSGPHYEPRSAVRRLDLGDDEAESVVPLPDEYQAGSPVGGMFPSMPFVKWADTLLVGFGPLPYLIVTDASGNELDRFEVPAVGRRGTPADPESAIVEELRGGRYFAAFALFSVTKGVHRRPDGSFLLVHADARSEEPPVSMEALWVSVIDQDRMRVCPDGVVPLGSRSRPAIGFDGDRMLVLEQTLRGGDAVSILRRIAVVTDECDWIPLRR